MTSGRQSLQCLQERCRDWIQKRRNPRRCSKQIATYVIEPVPQLDKYEILVGDSRAVKWVPCSGEFNLEALRARPVEGGREPDGAAIYIAQAPYHGAVHPGKACEIYGDGCFIPYDDSEKKVKVKFRFTAIHESVLLVYFAGIRCFVLCLK